jgi:putative sterol carrier protein
MARAVLSNGRQEHGHPDADRRGAGRRDPLLAAVGDGSVSAALGDADNAEVTISQSYDTAAKVNSGELDGQKAFTQGKVKIRARC